MVKMAANTSIWRSVNGKMIWPLEMKVFLVNRIREHIAVLGDAAVGVDVRMKEKAWNEIYKALIRRGMPDTHIRNVKKVWTTIRSSYRANARKSGTIRTRRSSLDLSELNKAMEEMNYLNSQIKDNGLSVMPMVIIKSTCSW